MILVKEEFLTEEKTVRAMRDGGPGVIVMWLALKGYCSRKNSGGFIPDEAIDDLQGAPRRPRVLLKSLVECGLKKPDGTRGSGLVDKVDHGWQLHDYDDHSTSQTDEELRRERARIKKQEQRAKRAEELDRLRGRKSDRPDDVPGTGEGQNAGQEEGQSRGHSAAGGGAPARVHARDPAGARARAGSQPSPAQPAAAAAAAVGGDAPEPNGKVRCPVPLPVPDDVIAGLELDVGLPQHVARASLAAWARQQSSDVTDMRTLGAWVKSAVAALRGRWSDPAKRAEMRALAAPPAPGEPPETTIVRPKTYAEIEREEAAREAARRRVGA